MLRHQFQPGDIVRERGTGVQAEVVEVDSKDESMVLCHLPGHKVYFKSLALELVKPAGDKSNPGKIET